MERPIIIGAGLAGLSAALSCARAGQACVLVSAQPSERSQSVMAEGGINAALDLMGEHDSVEQHAADTLRGGVNLAHPEAVAALSAGAPDVVRDLIGLGVPFHCEGGRMVQRYFGGQKKARTAYAQSSTGKVLVTALVDAVRRFEAQGLVTRLPHHELAALVQEAPGAAVRGVRVRDAYTGRITQLGGPVLLCSGGFAGLFGAVTTGTTTNSGDATACALAAGADLANLEFVQYHPTTIAIADKRLLISEAARGEGGRLVALRDGKPWYFMEERYPELGNLMPRDVVSREEAAVLARPDCGGAVYLDMRGLSAHAWRQRLADLRDECVHYLGIDPARELLPVEPGIHYCMGGVWVDRRHRTSLPGLWAAGECACQYHGANRLGGNSLLGAVFGGRVAAQDLLAAEAEAGALPASAANVPDCDGPLALLPDDAQVNARMQEILRASLGILRDGPALRAASDELAALLPACASERQRRRVQLARAAVACALAREESRGAHWRQDFPDTRDEYLRTTVVRLEGDELELSWRAVGASADAYGETAAPANQVSACEEA